MKGHKNFNREAVIEKKGVFYQFTENDLEELTSTGNYWHSKTDPSTWLCVSVVSKARYKFKKLTREEVIQFSAEVLNILPKALEHALAWNANYMAWHDGGEYQENHVYPV